VVSPRWRKLRGDLRAAWGRILLMQLAIAISLAGVGTVLGARAVLGREIVTSYLATSPADATLELAGGIDDALLGEVRALPDVAEADKRQMVRARVKLRPDDPWQMFVLFVADDFEALRLNTFRPDHGAWPPPTGTILVERTAISVMGLGGHSAPSEYGHGHAAVFTQLLGGGPSVIVQTQNGKPTAVAVSGIVHDAGQAPNWQEHRGCGYATLETLATLGEPPALHELLVQFRPTPRSMGDVEAAAAKLAGWLRERGHTVHEIRIPKLRQHPHQALMNVMQLVLLAFSLMLLVLCAIVLATMLSAMLTRQTREIGVMKAIGASTRQLTGLYAVFVFALGVVAVAIAAPLSYFGAHAMIRMIAYMMNITLAEPAIPLWVFAAQAALGTMVPLAIAAVPILRAARIPVRESLAHHGAGSDFVRPSLSRLPIAIRNALRRPMRLAMTMTLLVIGGALVLAASNVERGLVAISGKLAIARHYDIEIRLHAPATADRVADLASIEGVRTFEGWAATTAALGRPGQVVDIVHTYPDGGHGGLTLAAPPVGGSALVRFPVIEGRWLEQADTDAVVLGHNAARGTRPGDRITLSVGGVRSTWTVVGIVEEVGGGTAFVNDAAFRRATGQTGLTILRFATRARSDAERAAIVARLEARLTERGIAVQYAMPADLMRSIIDDHVFLVVRAVIAIAVILAFVGLLGLGAAMAVNVAERTREIGIMKAIGASDRRVLRVLLGEAAFIGATSSIIAAAVSLPLTAIINARIASWGFLAAPPFTISYPTLLGWSAAVVAGSMLASALPARRAARLSVRSALGEV
jgi:putative ABC transport system permease protein